ncbi:hypothetical protein [Niastella vici]|uniref:hypothetical protein n=1 Tax=Niastella vici TaxID=1703345 RepID=UPI00117D7B5D|nr:hypothetical protein [Niastella vici]
MRRLLLPFYLIHCLAHGQSIRYSSGTLYTGLGAYSHQFTQSFSFLANQASLGNLSRTSAGVYAEQKYGLKALSMYMATVAMPVNRDGIGISMQYSGFSDFNESQVGLAYGKNLGRLSVGIQCNYNMVHVAGYGNDAAVGVEVGSLWQINSTLVTGIHLINPVGGHFRNHSSEKLAAVYQFGAGYDVSKQLFLSAELTKEEGQPVNVQAGLQYVAVPDRLFVRAGITTATSSPYIGMGWQWKNCRADVSMRYHPQLGISPGLLLLFYGKQKTEP